MAMSAAVVLPSAHAEAPGDEPLCDDSIHDPVLIGVRDAGLDIGRGGCGRNELAVRFGGGAAIDTPRFYGVLHGGLSANVRFHFGKWEWGAGADVVDYTFAQNAVIKATALRAGPVRAHLARVGTFRLASLPAAWAVSAGVWLPFTETDVSWTSGGGQLALALTTVPHRRIALHLRAIGVAWATSSLVDNHLAAAAGIGVDAVVNTWRWLDVGVGADAQYGWRGGFDHALLRAALHWRVLGPYRGEAGLALRAAGAERTDMVVAVGARRDL